MIIKPVRIQRSRQHKMISPNGLPIVCVTRPSKFGNPFYGFELELCLAMFRNTVRGMWDPTLLKDKSDEDVHWFYTQHGLWLKKVYDHPTLTIKSELRGKNIACWCGLSEKCHGDILLRIANE